jgi:hypothetical protein
VVTDLSAGRYGIELPEGDFVPLIVDGLCANCPRNVFEGDMCAPVSVRAASVTKLDVVLDRATE